MANLDLYSKAVVLEEQLQSHNLIRNRGAFRQYSNSFAGKDAMQVMINSKLVPISVTNKLENQEAAERLGADLVTAGIIKHVKGDKKFKSSMLFHFVPGFKDKAPKVVDDASALQSNEVAAKSSSASRHSQSDNNSEASMYNLRLAALADKKHENALETRQQQEAAATQKQTRHLFTELQQTLSRAACTVIVFGASGHLAKTKTYPALYDLFCEGVLPDDVNIVGFARSQLSKTEFDQKISLKLKGDCVEPFLSRCTYFAGKGYDDDESYAKLAQFIASVEDKKYNGRSNRVAYLATPPTVFVSCCQRIKKYLKNEDEQKENGDAPSSSSCWLRVIIEKPFGKDLASSNALANSIASFLTESEVYRIDHYLAKELVQNIIVFRFSNVIWDAIWNRKYIRCVKISMKESAALEGRGGYYDEYGVIRDVLQNHLLQVLTLVAMEQPCSLRAEDVRDEKVKVLKCVKPMQEQRTVVAQYGASEDGTQVGYREDASIKQSSNPNSNQITFVQTVLFVDNGRWANVPFICKAGKALDSRNTEIRIQFKNDGLCLFPDANFNEIVMRLQPNEAIWCKVNNKAPGFARFDQAQSTELDITYKNRFGPLKLPEAYTRLILDALEGDQSLFVRSDELQQAWRIVTPFLHKLETENKDPLKYPCSSRGPPQADEIAQQYGFKRSVNYTWQPSANL